LGTEDGPRTAPRPRDDERAASRRTGGDRRNWVNGALNTCDRDGCSTL